MKPLLKALALLAAITSVVWIAVIRHWQATHRDINGEDLLTGLVVLPLVVSCLAIGLPWAVRSALARQAAASAAKAAAMTGELQPPVAEQRERVVAWPLLGAWVAGPAGDDVAGMLAAAKAGRPGPAPDPALRDGEGLPVMCARIESLDTHAVERAWAEWSDGLEDGSRRSRPQPHVMRALAALAPMLMAVGERTSTWWQGLQEERREGARVRVLALWPQSWEEHDHAWASIWLNAQLPASHESANAERWLVEPMIGGSGAQAWQQAEVLLQALERERSDDLLLMLACHSDVSEPAIDALEKSGLLFSADRHPKGRMPGEGAAAVLLMRAGACEPTTRLDAVAWLHRSACVRREESVEAPGRTSADMAQQAVSAAIAAAAIDAGAIGALCSDAERHSPRATELFAATIGLLPGLDPVEDMRLLGAVQGHACHTGALWAVAGAAAQARESKRPALALSSADPRWCMALVARPTPAESSAPRANT